MKTRTTKNSRTQSQGVRSFRTAEDSDPASFWRKRNAEEMHRFEQAWAGGSIHALADALIYCHREKLEMPLWLVQETLYCLKMFYMGKTLNRKGRLAKASARHHSALKDYDRWERVKELEERRGDILNYCRRMSPAERKIRPELFNLTLDYSPEQRCAVVAEDLTRIKSPAKGAWSTILRSYKRVEKDMKSGKASKYFIPSHRNPLRSSILD
jgi:hypothetical protein